MDFSLIKPGWEYNKETFGDISRADKVKQSLLKIAKNVQELTRLGVIYDIRDGSFSIRGQYYAPYEIVIVSHGGFLETMLEAELGGSKFFILCSQIKLFHDETNSVVRKSFGGYQVLNFSSISNRIILYCLILST